jgi:hypothetical protein
VRGFKPNSEVSVYIFSNPILLGTVTTNPEGNYTSSFPSPDGLDVGNHTIQLVGYLNDESFATLSLPVLVIEPTKSKTLRIYFEMGGATISASQSKSLKSALGKFDKKKKRFIITWAQNNTPVHETFISNIEAYAKFLNADIHVIAGRYKNPTSVFTDQKNDNWSGRVSEYLDANRHEVHKHMWIMSDVKIQPTAIDPMTGLQGMSGINSCVFGSPKVHMETIPVLEGNLPKMMLSTGACTVKNYTDSKAGKKGEFHHALGFVLVEIKDKDTFFARQVTATDDGDFNDLYHNIAYDPIDEVVNISRIEPIPCLV